MRFLRNAALIVDFLVFGGCSTVTTAGSATKHPSEQELIAVDTLREFDERSDQLLSQVRSSATPEIKVLADQRLHEHERRSAAIKTWSSHFPNAPKVANLNGCLQQNFVKSNPAQSGTAVFDQDIAQAVVAHRNCGIGWIEALA